MPVARQALLLDRPLAYSFSPVQCSVLVAGYSSYDPHGSSSGGFGGGGGGDSYMSPSEQQAAQERVQVIQQKLQVQQLVGKLTSTCFAKCYTRVRLTAASI